MGSNISGKLEGKPLFVDGSVSTMDGALVAGATVDVWHADGEGFYDVQQSISSERWREGRGLSQVTMDVLVFGPSDLLLIPFRTMDQSARCWMLKADIRSARRMYIS